MWVKQNSFSWNLERYEGEREGKKAYLRENTEALSNETEMQVRYMCKGEHKLKERLAFLSWLQIGWLSNLHLEL